jgi:hypothetical protein
MAGFGMFQQDFMSASDYENPNCNPDVYDPWCEHYKHEGRCVCVCVWGGGGMFCLWLASRCRCWHVAPAYA